MLHNNLSYIYNWYVHWKLHLNPNKFASINITNKRIPVSFILIQLGHNQLEKDKILECCDQLLSKLDKLLAEICMSRKLHYV